MKFLVLVSLLFPLFAEAKSYFEQIGNPARVAYADTLSFGYRDGENRWCFRGNIHELLFQIDSEMYGPDDSGVAGRYIDPNTLLIELSGLWQPTVPLFLVTRCEGQMNRDTFKCDEKLKLRYTQEPYYNIFDDLISYDRTMNDSTHALVWLKNKKYGTYQIRRIQLRTSTCEILSEEILE